MRSSAQYMRLAGWPRAVARPGAPTDPYVLALEHTVPQVTHLLCRDLVPQITIVRPPRPDYLQIVHSLPIFHSKSPGAARWRPSPDGRCRSNEMVERTCG